MPIPSSIFYVGILFYWRITLLNLSYELFDRFVITRIFFDGEKDKDNNEKNKRDSDPI